MFCGFYLALHTLGSCDIFSSVGIWVFDVKTRIYCQGVKNLNRTPKKGCRHGEKCVIFVKFQEWRHLASGLTRCLLWDILDCDGARKWFTKKIPNKKWVHGSKDVGFIKNQHFPAVCPQNGISGIRRYKPSFQNLNRRANARRKTRENDNLVTGCIYK